VAVVEAELMGTAREEYIERIKGTQLLPMTGLHYHIMDRIVTEMGPRFELDDLLHLLGSDIDFCQSKAVSGNIHRVKLFAMQTLQALIAVEMLKTDQPSSTSFWLV